MTVFTIIILVCSVALDHSACQKDTATDVIRGPKVANEIECGLIGQTTIAHTTLVPRVGREYLKIKCERGRG